MSFFEKFVKILSLQKLQLYECVFFFQSGASRCSHAHNELVEKVVKEDFFLQKNAFLRFKFAPKT